MRALALSLLCVSFAGSLAACGGDKVPVEEDFSELAGLDEKSDAFSYRMRILGSLDYGQTSDEVRYTSSPRFRAYKFAGSPGDQVEVWVRATNGGDAMAWVLDNSFRVLGSNDDADGTLDSHVSVQLTANSNPDIRTYYVVFRDYDLKTKKFRVSLDGKADFFACELDSDCVAVPQRTCCPQCRKAAVNASQVEAYASQPLICPAVLCPLACFNEERVPQCNTETKKCEMVEIADIACGGRRLHPRNCPEGYECQGEALAWDGPGSCVPAPKRCGGIAAFQCADTELCVDDPADDCDPDQGGGDCGGICKDKAFCSGALVKCAGGHEWSQTKCACVPL